MKAFLLQCRLCAVLWRLSAWTLRNWVILDYEEANGLTVRPWAPFLSFQSLERRNSLLNAWSWRTSLARGHSFSHWWAAVFDTILFLFWFLSNRMVSGDPYLALTPSAVVLNEEALNLEGQWRSRNAFQCCTRNWGLCLDSRALVQQKIGSQTIGSSFFTVIFLSFRSFLFPFAHIQRLKTWDSIVLGSGDRRLVSVLYTVSQLNVVSLLSSTAQGWRWREKVPCI